MSKHYLIYLSYSVILLIFFCTGTGKASSSNLKKLVIFQTSDIHSHIDGTQASWLNMAQMINRERSRIDPETASLLIDCGDTIPGSLIGAISQGKAAISILNVLKYDAWILGNHDLEFGFQRLNNLAKECSSDIIVANLQPEGKNNFINWKLYHKKGIKIALIGLTSPHITEWLWGNKLKEYRIIPTFPAIDAVMPAILKADPDIVILAIHHGRFTPARLNGFNIHKIADKYPQIDLILGGHSHQEVPGAKCGVKTWYVEAGAHAEKFAKIEVLINSRKKSEVNIVSKLIPVTKQKFVDPNILNCIKPWQQDAAKFAERIIGYTGKEITSTMFNSMFSNISLLFCRAIKEKVDVTAVFHGTVIPSAKFAGKITEQNIFDAIPYEDTICTLDLTLEELKTIIREQISAKKQHHFQSVLGLMLSKDSKNTLTIKMSNGYTLRSDKRYRCAFSSYTLAGAGGRFPELKAIALRKTSNGQDTGVTIREALRDYVKKHYPLFISDK